MNTHQLQQQIFEIDQRINKLELSTNKVITKEKINSIISNGDKYQTNFYKTKLGNGIKTGAELLIKIRGAKVVTGKISHNGQLLIINQSHSKDKDNDASTINFKLKHRRFRLFNYNLPLGTYELHIWFFDKDTGERGMYKDKFEIVA